MAVGRELKTERPPRRLALLFGLLLSLVVAPPVIYWLSHYVPDSWQMLMIAPIYAQGVYPGSIFGRPLFAMGEAGPYPVGVSGWAVTIMFWLVIAVGLWATIRWLRWVTNS
jgi:hypothetical protein